MKNSALPASRRYRNHIALVAIVSVLVLISVFALTTLGAQAAAVDDSSRASLGLHQAANNCIDGDVFAVVNGGDYGLGGWNVHVQLQNGTGPVYDAVTNGNGYYKIDGLTAGSTYKVWIDIPADWELYSGVTNPRENVVVPANGCASVLFKVQQTGSGTPGTPEPATRVDGNVYEETCNGIVPLDGELLQIWASDHPTQLGGKLQDRYTDASGYFNFHILPAYLKDYLHVILVVPSDMEVVSTLAPEGVVLDDNHIRFDFPTIETFSGNQFRLRKKDLVCETPTPTPTPTITPTATPFKLYLPIILTRPPMCEVAYLAVNVWGKDYHIPLQDVPYNYTLRPLPWQHSTTFMLKEYQGDARWTQYQPVYHKQIGGMEFVYPGGHSGDEFILHLRTDCGEIAIRSDVDDPTPTPSAGGTPTARWIDMVDESFDDGTMGSAAVSGDPTWSVSTCEAASGSNSVWATGSNGADCDDAYPGNANAWMVFGPFDLSDAAQAKVTFDYLMQTKEGQDWFAWYASDDNENWVGFFASGDSDGWTSGLFDLQNWLGKSDVWIALAFESDAAGADKGVFVDNLKISKYVDGRRRAVLPLIMAPAAGESVQPATVKH